MAIRPYTQDSASVQIKRRDPLLFMLWIAMGISSTVYLCLFVYFYRQLINEESAVLALPFGFWVSTAGILCSSITLHEAIISFRNERFRSFRIGIGITFVLGLFFILFQVRNMYDVLNGSLSSVTPSNPEGMVCLLTGLHLVHLFVGMILVGYLFIKVLINYTYIDAFIFSVNPPSKHKLQLTTIYWHFLTLLWLVTFTYMIFLFSN